MLDSIQRKGSWQDFIGKWSFGFQSENDDSNSSNTTPSELNEKTNQFDSPLSGVELLQSSESPANKDEAITRRDSLKWSPNSGTVFHVRQGPNYRRRKIKDYSTESMYEIIDCIAFRTDECTTPLTMVNMLPLPTFFENKGDCPQEPLSSPFLSLRDERLPQILIVHFQLPYEEPSLFHKKIDGKGAEVVFYLAPSQSFVNESNQNLLKQGDYNPMSKFSDNSQVENVLPSTELFTEWCDNCDKIFQWRSRFKCLATVRDVEKLGNVASLIKPYNGKPVLVTESGSVKKGVTKNSLRYLEMSANVHKWSYFAKKGLHTILPQFSRMSFDFGFLIEARDDAEMPECMLGSVFIDKIDPMKLPTLSELQSYKSRNTTGI